MAGNKQILTPLIFVAALTHLILAHEPIWQHAFFFYLHSALLVNVGCTEGKLNKFNNNSKHRLEDNQIFYKLLFKQDNKYLLIMHQLIVTGPQVNPR